MTEKSALSLVSLQKSVQDLLKNPESKEACLSFQYKLLLLYSSQFGVYLLPQIDTMDIWHGAVFVRFGIYKEGVFKFKMVFDGFPERPPQVFFVTPVFHPLVDAETGQLELDETLRNWRYGQEHLVFSVIEYIRLIFVDVRKYEQGTLNANALEMYKNALDQFYDKAVECVRASKNSVYNNYANASLKFQPPNQKHAKIRHELTALAEDQQLSQEEKKKKLIKLLKD